jgi:hypothetical protein
MAESDDNIEVLSTSAGGTETTADGTCSNGDGDGGGGSGGCFIDTSAGAFDKGGL